MKKLVCKILNCTNGYVSPNYAYWVYDWEELVSSWISSSESFVKNDAWGYHTKDKFDKKYPDWREVVFNF